MKKRADNYDHINGWGIDADPLDVPSYPMKHRTENDNLGMVWERPPQQAQRVEILHSNERPNVSAVFGTPNPPTGLSGRLRRFAFQYSEGTWTHWLMLLLADRLNAMEGIGDDLKNGHVPNLFEEHGGYSELKYNKAGLIRKVATGVAIAAVFIAFKRMRSRES